MIVKQMLFLIVKILLLDFFLVLGILDAFLSTPTQKQTRSVDGDSDV